MGFGTDIAVLSDDSNTIYHTIAIGLVTRSITEFSLHGRYDALHRDIGQLLPDIWVAGDKLYQYQTLDDEERQRYVLTYHDLMSDPYLYVDDPTLVITSAAALGSGRLITMLS